MDIKNQKRKPILPTRQHLEVLYDMLPEGNLNSKLLLRFALYTGMNPIDILAVTLADFQEMSNGTVFLEVLQHRAMTNAPKCVIPFSRALFDDLSHFVEIQNKQRNEPIFADKCNIYHNLIKQTCERFALPSTNFADIRRLTATLLSNYLRSHPPSPSFDFFNRWFGHSIDPNKDNHGIIDCNWINDHLQDIQEILDIANIPSYSSPDPEKTEELAEKLKELAEKLNIKPSTSDDE